MKDMKIPVLLIEDDEGLVRQMRWALDEFEVTTADVRTYGSEGGYGDSSTRSDAVQCPVCKGQIPVPNPLNWK